LINPAISMFMEEYLSIHLVVLVAVQNITITFRSLSNISNFIDINILYGSSIADACYEML